MKFDKLATSQKINPYYFKYLGETTGVVYFLFSGE